MSTRTLQVFVLDDDEVDRMTVTRTLVEAGDVEVHEFETADATLDALQREPCDCLLLDYRMPDTDGLEFLDALRDAKIDVPVIMLTGAGDEEVAVSSIQRGALDYLNKNTIDSSLLASKIRSARMVHEAQQRAIEAERDLRETVVQLRHEALARESMLGVVSHDLRGPLNNIRLALNLLGSDVPAQRDLALASVNRAVTRAERLIRDLLDVARMSGAEFELDRRTLSARALAETAALDVRPAAEAKRVELELDIEDEVGELSGDRERILQVLDNLLRNGIKYGPQGGRLVLAARDRGEHVEFAVRDEGPGLSAEACVHVFDKFWQAKSADRAGGSGLGLAIAKSIVNAHGGRIDVVTEEGKGACFYFVLPRVAVAPIEAVGSQPHRAAH